MRSKRPARPEAWTGFPGGVIFINLFGYHATLYVDTFHAIGKILTDLGLLDSEIPENLEDRKALYQSHLYETTTTENRILLILDNAAGEEQISDLIPSSPNVRVLVTSRQILSIGLLVRVGHLDDEAGADLISMALRQTTGLHDTRVSGDRASAVALSQLCGGLPLALRIVSSLLTESPNRPLSSMVSDLSDAESRLSELSRQHIAVRSAFDMSYRSLDPQSAQLLALISLNPGPDFSTEAAAAAIAATVREARVIVEKLARANLVEPRETYGRWQLHDLIRLYAQEKVDQDPERSEAAERLIAYYLTAAAKAFHWLRDSRDEDANYFSSRDQALAWFDLEVENLIHAVTVAHDEGLYDFAFLLPLYLAPYLDMRRRLPEWAQVARIAAHLAEMNPDEMYQSWALDSLGMALRELREITEATTVQRRAVEISRRLGRDEDNLRFLINLGWTLRAGGRFQEAYEVYMEAHDIAVRLGDRLRQARSLGNAGATLGALGRLDEAEVLQRQVLQIFIDEGDRGGEARALTQLGCTLIDSKQLNESIELHKRAVLIFSELDLEFDAARSRYNLANALIHNDRSSDALDELRKSLKTFDRVGDEHHVAMNRNIAGMAHMSLRNLDAAIDSLQSAASAFSGLGDVHGQAQATSNLGRAYALSGKFEEAQVTLLAGAELFAASGDYENRDLARSMAEDISNPELRSFLLRRGSGEQPGS
ncbi:tetratricopeptide repeat protein [Streptomyces sp. NPDC046977]|uniref:tetratricopeptide repeat protein n=1 Tax=Streptomyces sp. NPDC046977 TaxID=3154703 RepID=UPI0033F05561